VEQSSRLLQCNETKAAGALKTARARSACFAVTEELGRPMSDMNERLIETSVAVVGK
jgi:hypothetical protein